jgi:hypothetical protein
MKTDESDKKSEVSLRAAFFAAKQSPDELRLLRRDPEKNIGAGEHPPRNDTQKSVLRLWLARLLIAVVVAWNLQCALAFLLHPEIYAPGFELAGIPGQAAVRGCAVLFIMWNVPYLVALWQPRRNRLSLWQALAMQTIGVIGESLILVSIPVGYSILHASILRFITFDAAGVVLLIGAVLLLIPSSRSNTLR